MHTEAPVVGIFEQRRSAETAVDELWHAGFAHDQVGYLIPGQGVVEAHTATEDVEEKAARGTKRGAAAGGALGALAGAAIVGLLPGVGMVLAGGVFAGMIIGAAAGAAVGTFAGPFIAMGLSEGEAQRCEDAVAAGKTIVVVQAGDRLDKALEILRSHGAEIELSPVLTAY
jgi:hypothetical protein